MSTTVNEVLGLWREAERVLRSLPPLHPDHETVRLTALRLSETYQRLTDRSPEAQAHVADGEVLIREARALLRRVSAKGLGLEAEEP